MRSLALCIALGASSLAAQAVADSPLTRVRDIDCMGPWPTHVAMSPAGSVCAWVDADRGLTCVAVADGERRAHWTLPPGRVRRVAFVDEDLIDVWIDAAHGAPASALRWSLARGGTAVGAAGPELPEAADPGRYRDRFHADLVGSSLRAVAVSRDAAACLGLWENGQVTLLSGEERTELVDAWCRGVAFSRDGRWLVAVMTTRVVVADVDRGDVHTLPVAVASVGGVAAGSAGSDVVVVTAEGVQVWDAPRQHLLRTVPLPVEQGRVDVRQACAGGGSIVAVRGWIDRSSSKPWLGLVDLDSGSWRSFAFAHGSMEWSFDGETLVVGAGGPFDASVEADVVRLVPRLRGPVQEVSTRGYHSVTVLPGGSFFGVDSVGTVYRCDCGRVRPTPAEVWGDAIALSNDWLVVRSVDLVLRTLDGAVRLPVMDRPVAAIAVAREHRRLVATRFGMLRVLQWPRRLPRPATPRKPGASSGKAW
jgi:hypothetical protein